MSNSDPLLPPSRRDIPAANYRMHSLHCARNIALCAACDETVPRGELEEHQQEFHSTKHCPDCGAAVEAAKLEEHKASLCLKRVEICKYCALSQEVGELKEHMEYCGSRTEKCEECKEIIMLRNWEMHIDSNHGFIKLKDGKASFLAACLLLLYTVFHRAGTEAVLGDGRGYEEKEQPEVRLHVFALLHKVCQKIQFNLAPSAPQARPSL